MRYKLKVLFSRGDQLTLEINAIYSEAGNVKNTREIVFILFESESDPGLDLRPSN